MISTTTTSGARAYGARPWSSAAAVAFIAGAAATGVTFVGPASASASGRTADLAWAGRGSSDVGAIALRRDPANFDRLVVDFIAGRGSGGARGVARPTWPTDRFDEGGRSDRWPPPDPEAWGQAASDR